MCVCTIQNKSILLVKEECKLIPAVVSKKLFTFGSHHRERANELALLTGNKWYLTLQIGF